MRSYNFLAFDLGATSGRTVLGTLCNGKIETKELTRFPNAIVEVNGKFFWNLLGLYESLKEGLAACAKEGITPDSIGIDTWGVDVVPIGKDGSILGMPRAYRDSYTDGAPEKYFEIIPREEVYDKTGIQVMNFNTLYQIYAAVQEGYTPITQAERLLFMPDALSYMLTGKQVCEYTIASTSQILNPRTKDWEAALLKAAGVKDDILPKPIFPGAIIGELNSALAAESRIGRVPVVAVAGHDTASAVAAVPAENERFAYLSSGTWSLMGIETREPIINEESFRHNFTNEGGVDGTTRFLKNICGMWILEQCRKEWERDGKSYTYPEIVDMANSTEPFLAFINPDDASFANPQSMLKAIEAFCLHTGQRPPQSDKQIIRTIFESLALRYREVLEILESMSPFAIDVLHIIGGGSKNALLNQFTANAIGKHVVAGPSEATAIGNIMMQAVGAGVISSLAEARAIIRASVDTEEFTPQNSEEWNTAYKKFQTLK
uniref:rhamnulokinase n=1 Tax=Alistipes sp. TaxID=1872444 RepID=UPI004056BFE7